jgi:predicted transcriptional regulator
MFQVVHLDFASYEIWWMKDSRVQWPIRFIGTSVPTTVPCFPLTNSFPLQLPVIEHETNNENNRGKIEIMADVVYLSTSGIKKTHIMYKANLSYDQINRYLRELLKLTFIEIAIDEGTVIYRATEKGRLFLHHYYMMRKTMYSEYEMPCVITNDYT